MIELNELQDAVQKAFPADKVIPERDASWALAAEMGWLMIRLPEELGGLGLGREASTMIHFELGRVLSSAPLIPAQLGLHAVLESTTLEGRDDWLERIAGGEYVPLHMLPTKLETGSDSTVSGTVSGVFEGDMAAAVIAYLPGGYTLVPTDAPGVSLVERPIWDKSRRLFDLVLENFRPDASLSLADAAGSRAIHDAISPEAHLAVAADCLGGANAALDTSVEYMKMRKQFDRPIAMFQALKHRAADCKIKIVPAEALLWSRAAADAVPAEQMGGLKTYAAEVYQWVTEEAIQFHGGIGLTEEHHIHLFMKRAMLNLQLCGASDLWNERVGRAALAR
ncbi:acyl-CoA dehydrogenase family protein [Novosphingobium sp. RD2P27]|uniref:Acyl-CoA dehydrogenase family protein n=1 Tax=Novosphingobium kalidii TaxID=3230299 RepID=A0ABV2CZL1_9SPHN